METIGGENAMLDIVTRAGSFVAIILLGYFLKKIGFFKQEDFTILSRITIRITLPAAIILPKPILISFIPAPHSIF